MASDDGDRPVTIYTVAERAGVSIATVSRVLKGSTPASPMTRRKVLRAVEELDYVPLRSSRPVDVPRHQTHGLVLPGLYGPYFSELLTGFESTAAQYGQSVVVVLANGPVDVETSLRTRPRSGSTGSSSPRRRSATRRCARSAGAPRPCCSPATPSRGATRSSSRTSAAPPS